MRRQRFFIATLFLLVSAILSPLIGADEFTYRGDNEGDSVIVSDDIFARLVEFDKQQKLAVERRRAINDSLAALAQVPPERVLRLACVGDMMLGVNYPSPMLTPLHIDASMLVPTLSMVMDPTWCEAWSYTRVSFLLIRWVTSAPLLV